MPNRLKAVLDGAESNYLLPFLWQRGESEEVIRDEMARVHASGIAAVCVEARPHPDFLGPRWWRDMDIIMDEARRRHMRVWLLDDDHFPTGRAAGANANAPAALHRMFLKERHLDAIGPQNDASIPLKPWRDMPVSVTLPDTIVSIVATRRDPENSLLTDTCIDLCPCIHGDVIRWNIPAGVWRISLIIASYTGGSKEQRDYVNPIVAESVRVLIDTVYERHFEHYRDDFGKTFAGFFSDEPGFYNDPEMYNGACAPGRPGIELPWRLDMAERLTRTLGSECRLLLPLLWHDGGPAFRSIRCAYMDLVSRLYAECFTQQLGDWCRAHGVEYIGHVLEDNGVHTRLGPSVGHYFRALHGQDMSGIDVVLWQLVPGLDQGRFAGPAGEMDAEFFHYGLGKLCSSLAHIDPHKKGRALCELFGAYGWREGLKLMKWMTDHLLVRGINHFVPHAFSQKEFPDGDCPPHFYARGNNPQYRYYHELNRYTNRLAHLLSGGTHIASAAVLYHAEAEWSARADSEWMPFHRPVAALLRNQIDCDVLPGDALADPPAALQSHGKLAIAGESYDCLIVPYARMLPSALLARLSALAAQGIPLFFVNALPESSSDGDGMLPALESLRSRANVLPVALSDLAKTVRGRGFFEIETESVQPYLRYYHVRHPDLDVYLFVNEHPFDPIETGLRLPGRGPFAAYDAFRNRLRRIDQSVTGDCSLLPICLSPYESLTVIAGVGVPQSGMEPSAGSPDSCLPVTGPWSVSLTSAAEYPAFTMYRDIEELVDMSSPEMLPAFSGTFRYESHFAWKDSQRAIIDIGDAYETAQVWINGREAGIRICPPYRFDIGDTLHPGMNELAIEVTNTLVKAYPDWLSRYVPQEPSGLLGPVRILC